MSNAAAFREETFVDQTAPLPNREEVLAHYFRLREISKRHNDNVMKFLGKGAILNHARRLGLTYGKILMADSMDELTLAADLAIHTAPPDRTRAIEGTPVRRICPGLRRRRGARGDAKCALRTARRAAANPSAGPL